MSDIAIRVEGLGKRYRIGQRERSYAFRDVLADLVTAPWRALRRGPAPPAERAEIWALKDVSFEVRRGEVVGVIGRNGAGKSTLLKILSRITEPTEGYAEVRGTIGSLLEVGTGFHPELTGRENVYLNGAILGMRRSEVARKFDAIVAFADVERFIDTPVKHYSSGMHMRLAFAVAAHLDTSILLVDEVLAVGDAAFQKKCLGKMHDVATDGRTVLFVSHNMAAVENLCSCVVLVQHGRTVANGDPKTIISAYLRNASPTPSNLLGPNSRRTGSGRMRFTGFQVEDESGFATPIVQTGHDVILVFGYACLDPYVHPPRNVVVGFGIHAATGERLAVHYSSYTDQDFPTVPRSGQFRMKIKRLPLAPGRYFLFPRIEINGEEADFPRDGIGFLDVDAGDFYGTGKMIGDRGNASFLIDGDWSLNAQPDQHDRLAS